VAATALLKLLIKASLQKRRDCCGELYVDAFAPGRTLSFQIDSTSCKENAGIEVNSSQLEFTNSVEAYVSKVTPAQAEAVENTFGRRIGDRYRKGSLADPFLYLMAEREVLGYMVEELGGWNSSQFLDHIRGKEGLNASVLDMSVGYDC